MRAQPRDRAVLRVLGPVTICVDGRPVPVGASKPRRLLAALILHRNTVVSTGRLMDVVWGDDVPDTGLATLQAYVSRLRRVLPSGARLVTEAPGYRLVVDATADRRRPLRSGPRRRLGRRSAAAPADALAHLDAALAEWRGDAFAEFADEPWSSPRRRG